MDHTNASSLPCQPLSTVVPALTLRECARFRRRMLCLAPAILNVCIFFVFCTPFYVYAQDNTAPDTDTGDLQRQSEALADAQDEEAQTAELEQEKRALASLTPEQLDRLVLALGSSSSPKVRLQAAILLGRAGSLRPYTGLVEALRDDAHYTVRGAAAIALASLDDGRAVPSLIRQQALDSEAFVRKEAARALQSFYRVEALSYFLSSYNSEDPRVRLAAIEHIQNFEQKEAAQLLVRALGDMPKIAARARKVLLAKPVQEALKLLRDGLDSREPQVKRGVVKTLEAMQSDAATKLILSVYQRDIEVDEVRRAARDALRNLRQYLPIQQFVEDVRRSDDRHQRVKALKLLGVVGGGEAQKVIADALSDQDIYVRGNAVMALADTQNAAALEQLRAMLEDPRNERIEHLIRHAIKQLERNP